LGAHEIKESSKTTLIHYIYKIWGP